MVFKIKAILFGVLIAPFFVFGQSFNLFESGNVITLEPKTTTSWRCNVVGTWHANQTLGSCRSLGQDSFENRFCQGDHGCRNLNITENQPTEFKYSYYITAERCTGVNTGTGECYKWEEERSTEATADNPSPSTACPPDSDPDYTYPIDDDGDGKPEKCANPDEIPLHDSCNIMDIAPNPVSQDFVCIAKDDGSVCAYQRQTLENGNDIYGAIEHNCYDDLLPSPEGLPINPPESGCSDTGWGLVCVEEPENVCTGLETSTPSCVEGCGFVNGDFACYTTDDNQNDIPDYLETPEPCEGDSCEETPEPCEGDSCEETPTPCEGDSCEETPTPTPCEGDSCEETPVVVNVDLGELGECPEGEDCTINKTPSDEIESLWESEYPDGIQGIWNEKEEMFKQTAFFTFLDQFKPSFSGASYNNNWCFNFGRNMNLGCFDLSLDPRVIPAIKVFLLILTAFACRRIIFGG